MAVTMIDTIHDTVRHIPTSAPKVAGYVTGTPDIRWADADWARFPTSGQVRIDQSRDLAHFAAGKAHVADIEPRAGGPEAFTSAVEKRIKLGIAWSTAYGRHEALEEVEVALNAREPHGWYYGHVNCWLADWNFSHAEAESRLGALVHGMSCVAVQWASPTSNPETILPGSTRTLKDANCDLSVTADWWHAYEHPRDH